MKNINLTYLKNEELIDLAEKTINKYESQRSLEDTYEKVSLKDLQELERHLQRTILFSKKGRDTHEKVNEILANDAGLKEPKKSITKSTFEVLRERNGYGRYTNTIK